MKDKKFCKGCGKKLAEQMQLFGGEKIHEFKDGWYCDACARIKVKKARR